MLVCLLVWVGLPLCGNCCFGLIRCLFSGFWSYCLILCVCYDSVYFRLWRYPGWCVAVVGVGLMWVVALVVGLGLMWCGFDCLCGGAVMGWFGFCLCILFWCWFCVCVEIVGFGC